MTASEAIESLELIKRLWLSNDSEMVSQRAPACTLRNPDSNRKALESFKCIHCSYMFLNIEAKWLMRRAACNRRNQADAMKKQDIYQCRHCTYSTTLRTNYEKHFRTHAGEKMWLDNDIQSADEGRVVGRKATLVTSRNCPETYYCPHCTYNSVDHSEYLDHFRTHMGGKTYSCPQCSYQTLVSSNFKRHIRIHTGEKPYFCPYCPYRSNEKAKVKRHLLSHNK
nr:RE1-silencing transcription factor B-like [Penaeus vannamei]